MPSTATDRISGISTSVAVKAPVYAATTGNITLSGAQTVDTFTPLDGYRILVRAQDSAVENGVYDYSSTTTWTRSEDFAGARDVVGGTLIAVNNTSASNRIYRVDGSGAKLPGTDAIAFSLEGFVIADNTAVTVQNLAALKDVPITNSLVHVLSRTTPQDGYEGAFIWRTGNFTTQAAADPAEAIYVTSNSVAISAGAWVRQYTGAVLPQWWGWKPDSTPANAAAYDLIYPQILSFLNFMGGGAIDFRTDGSNYFPMSKGQVLYDNIEMFSSTASGPNGHVRHVNPDNDPYFKGIFAYPSTYGANNAQSIEQAVKYNLSAIALGAPSITFTTPAEAANFAVGSLIVVASAVTWLKGAGQNIRRLWYECNEVTTVDAGTGVVGLKYRMQEAISGTPLAINVNQANGPVHPVLNIVNRMTRNLHIHNLHITQADRNEVADTALVVTPSFLFQIGGTFESKFHDLTLECFGGWAGNQWYRCEIHDIDLRSNRHIFDLGYGSHNTELYDWKWTYLPSAVASVLGGLIYMGESTHDNTVRGIKVNGSGWNGNSVIQGERAIRWHVHDIDFYLPTHDTINMLLLLNDEEPAVFHEDLRFHDITFRGSTCGRLIDVDGNTGPTGIARGLIIENVKFLDITDKLTNTASFIRIRKTDGVTIRGIRTEITASLEASNFNNCVIEEFYAPNMGLAISGTNAGNKFLRNTWRLQGHHIRLPEKIDVTSTTPNNEVASTTIPAGTLADGDGFHLEVWGRVFGTTGDKTIQFTAGGTVFGTVNFLAAEVGQYRIYAEQRNEPGSGGSEKQFVYFQADKLGVLSSGFITTNIDTNAVSYKLALEAWRGGTDGGIAIFGYEITPISDYSRPN